MPALSDGHRYAILSGTEVNVYCPDCSPPPKLVVRKNHINQHYFLACPNYPNCRHTQPLSESIVMDLLGYPHLPGIDT